LAWFANGADDRLELVEPSLFFTFEEGAATLLAQAIAKRVH